MPYIADERRRRMLDIGTVEPDNVGELTYKLTRVVDSYIAGRKPAYQNFAAVLGALTATSHEVYRRVIAPYEDKKCLENGDVYWSIDRDSIRD